MMNGIQFQSVQTPNALSSELRSVIRDNVLQFYVQGNGMDVQEEGITALYERLSQEDKLDGESNSIANQKKILERYCKDHGYTAIRHYDEDDGYSGTNFNRPGFQRMLADIKAGKIKRVIVKDMSRFGRDYLQVGMYTDVLFPEFGVHFIAVNDGVDSTRGENEFTAIRNVFNEMYARDTSKKIRATWQSKGKSGEHLTTIPPYRKGKDLCTTHSIRNVVLHEIVLKNLREAIQYVSQHEAEFMQEAADISMRDRDAEFARKRDTLAKADKRIAELDRIISRLYEDNVMGKLSDDRFIKMSHDYELEQSNLKSMAEVLRKELKQQEQQKTNAKAFVSAVKKYTDMQELDAAVLREFIDRIEVSHADKKSKTREITIVYNFIGAFDFTRAIEEARNTTQKQQKTA